MASTCEQCGAIAELMAHGRRLESARRMDICVDCVLLNEPDTSRAILESVAPNADPGLIEAFIALAQGG